MIAALDAGDGGLAVGDPSDSADPTATTPALPLTSSSTVASTTQPALSGGPTVITGPPSEAGQEGIVAGTLIERDGCLYIDDDAGLGVAVFRYGTTWDSATASVVDPDGTAVTVGQYVYSGGGQYAVDERGDPDSDVMSTVRRCAELVGATVIHEVGLLTAGSPP